MLLLCLLAFHVTSTCGLRSVQDSLQDASLSLASDDQAQLDAELVAVEDSTDFAALRDNQSEVAKVHSSHDVFQGAEGGNNQSAETEQGRNPVLQKFTFKFDGCQNPPAVEILSQKFNYAGVKDWADMR